MKYEVIPFNEFMLGVSWMPPALPLMEGLVGFGTLGAVLIFITIAEKKGWLTVNENIIKGGLML